MFTPRQIGIIAYLIGKDEFVSGEQLAANFDLGKKTLQSEIRDLENQLAGDCRIISGPKGYRLEYLTATAREHLHAELEAYGGKNSLGIRPSSFVLYLLFQQNYVSMQQLADSFYLSKTAVALEILTVKRWIERYDGLTLEVSGQQGIRIVAEEQRKRVYCAKFGNLFAFQSVPFPKEVSDGYATCLEAASQVLQAALPENGYLITGEEFRKISRFIAVSILRSRMGYPRGKGREGQTPNGLLRQISSGILGTTQYQLQPAELADIWALLEESNVLLPPAFHDTKTELERQLNRMEERLRVVTGLDVDTFFPDRLLVLQYLDKAARRMKAGNVAINHYNEDIVRRYPLEVHLMYRLLLEYFGGHVTKETSFMALFLSNGLGQCRDGLSILLVSDQSPSISCQIEAALRQCADGHSITLTVLPRYVFENDPEIKKNYDLLLATDQETLLKYPEFSLIPCVLFPEDENTLSRLLGKATEKKRTFTHQEILRVYLREETINDPGEADLSEIIGYPHDGFQSYHTFGKKNIYIGRIAPDMLPQITVYDLQRPVSFQYKKIYKIIFACYPEGKAGILPFFHTVMELIRQS